MLFTKINALTEEDFAFFRLSFQSKRQVPSNIGKGLYGGILIQVFFGFFHYLILDTYMTDLGSFLTTLIIISSITTVIISILSIIFTISKVYQNKQHIQYIVANIMLFDISGLSFFVIGLFILDLHSGLTETTLLIVFIIALVLLFATLCFFFIRFTRLLQRDGYREDSNEIDLEETLAKEKSVTSNFSRKVVSLTGLILIVQFILNNYVSTDFEMRLVMTFLLVFPFFAVYMLSYSFVVYYCKKRFQSFNFDENGELYPVGSGDRIKA